MEVNISDYATEGVLSMECENGRWILVTYLSKSLNEMEKNYKIHDKEMLAIIRGLENWRYLLESTCFKFEIWTDHKNLEYFMKVQKLNHRQAWYKRQKQKEHPFFLLTFVFLLFVSLYDLKLLIIQTSFLYHSPVIILNTSSWTFTQTLLTQL